MAEHWSIDAVSSLDGLTAVVTGSSSGLGLETTRALRAKGATVIMACRNPSKAEAAATELQSSGPGPKPVIVELELEVEAGAARPVLLLPVSAALIGGE